MRKGGGKQKGNAFERQVCKDLSLWYTQGKMADLFWRSAMSGGRATVRAKKDKSLAHVAGDICAVHSSGQPFIDKFYVECKFYRDLGLAQAVTQSAGMMLKFWRETKKQAAEYGKMPILIFRQNRLPAMVGLSTLAANDFEIEGSVVFTNEDLHLLPYAEIFGSKNHWRNWSWKESRPKRPRLKKEK